MNYHPTFNEYMYSRKDNIVKSANGYCYLITNSKIFSIIFKCLVFIIPVGIPLLQLLISRDQRWPNIVSDCVVLAALTDFSINKIQYLKTAFKEINETDIIQYDDKTREWLNWGLCFFDFRVAQ